MQGQRGRFALFLFCYYAHAGSFTTFASLLFAARGMSAPEVGILMSLIPVMRIIGPNVWGWLADHSGHRLWILRGTAIGALVAFAAIFFADSFHALFWAMAALNLFTSGQTPLSEALLMAEMRGDLHHYGKIRLWGSAGFIAAVLGFGYWMELQGIHLLPTLSGVMLVATIAAAFSLKATPPVPHTGQAPSVWTILKRRDVQAFFVSSGLQVGGHMALYAYYSLYLETFGYSKTVIGVLWSFGVLCEILFFNFQGPVFQRFGAPALMRAGLLLAGLRFAVIGAAPSWIWVLVAMQALHAATFAAHHSACLKTLHGWFGGALQARGQALFISLAYGVGGSLGGLAMAGVWKVFGPQAIFFLASALSLAGWAILRKSGAA